MITPGPVVITTGFIGYLVGDFPRALVAAGAAFLPPYLLTVFPAPYFRKSGGRPTLAAIVDGVTAAAMGAIIGAVIVLGRRAIIDLPTALLALGALLVLWKSPRRIPEPVLGASCVIGNSGQHGAARGCRRPIGTFHRGGVALWVEFDAAASAALTYGFQST